MKNVILYLLDNRRWLCVGLPVLVGSNVLLFVTAAIPAACRYSCGPCISSCVSPQCCCWSGGVIQCAFWMDLSFKQQNYERPCHWYAFHLSSYFGHYLAPQNAFYANFWCVVCSIWRCQLRAPRALRLVQGKQHVACNRFTSHKQEVAAASARRVICARKEITFFENSYVDNEALKEQIRLFISRKKGSSALDALSRLEWLRRLCIYWRRRALCNLRSEVSHAQLACVFALFGCRRACRGCNAVSHQGLKRSNYHVIAP